jgi:hypothetical protein
MGPPALTHADSQLPSEPRLAETEWLGDTCTKSEHGHASQNAASERIHLPQSS